MTEIGSYPYQVTINKIPSTLVEKDKLEYSTDKNDSDQYLQYAKAKPNTIKKVTEIVRELVNCCCVCTVVDTTLGSGSILKDIITDIYNHNISKPTYIGYEQNDIRRSSLPSIIKDNVILRKEFNGKELKDIENKYKDICLICDPPWGSWKIMDYQHSILGIGDYKTMGDIMLESQHIHNFIFILPKNYYIKDLKRVTKKIKIFKTGKTCRVVWCCV